MPSSYSIADEDTIKIVRDVMERHHKPLHAAQVRIGVLMTSELRVSGYPAFASIKIVPLKDRMTKQYDAELLIDLDEWNHMRVKHKHALVDHELSHIELAKSRKLGAEVANGISFDRDDLGRPKLKLVKGDWNGSDGFKAVVERHGDFAIEFLSAKRCHTYAVAARDGVKPETQAALDAMAEGGVK